MKQIATNSVVESTWDLLKQYLAYRITTVISEYLLKFPSAKSEQELQSEMELIAKRVNAYQLYILDIFIVM